MFMFGTASADKDDAWTFVKLVQIPNTLVLTIPRQYFCRISSIFSFDFSGGLFCVAFYVISVQ